jgi:two-component system sensor histidine kinase DegS
MIMANSKTGQAVQEEPGIWETLRESFESDFEHTKKELKEISLMIEQSQLEVNKLTQRNASITVHLQQVQSNFDGVPRPDIRMAYDSALDVQQRLFVMRGQLDKLQSDRTHLEKYSQVLEKVLDAFGSGAPQGKQKKSITATTDTVEMMVQAQESERQRLARQMHDGPAQALSNFILQTEIAMRLFDVDQGKAREELKTLKTAATSTFQKVRDFIFELRPMMLDDLGLAPTLTRYVETFKDQTGLDVRFMSTGMEQRLEPYVEVMIFRAIQELLSNAARHSQATQIKLQTDYSAGEIKVNIEDNGKGFDEEITSEQGGMGLKVIRDRVEMLGGTMLIDSIIGKGTSITFQIPAVTTSASTAFA